MRRFLLALALLALPASVQAQHPRNHLWSYSNPYTGHYGHGFSNSVGTFQYGVSPRQDRFLFVAPAYPAYNYGYPGGFYGGFQGGFVQQPFYGGFGGGY
jgi:hypothetical protein